LKVELFDLATIDFEGFDNSSKQSILLGLRKLENEPQKRGRMLSGNLHPLRRLVVGKKQIRILFRVYEERDLCRIVAIGARRDDEVYKIAAERLAKLEE
jgi:mRNA interferase RelE/StbE